MACNILPAAMFCMISHWIYLWPSELEKVHPFVLMIVKFDKHVAHNNRDVVQIKKTDYKQEQPTPTNKKLHASYFHMLERTHVLKHPC